MSALTFDKNPLPAALMGISLTLASAMCGIGNAYAVGTGTVVAGSATITHPNANTTIITQTSAKSVIDWTGAGAFNTTAGQTVKFVQPTATSISLNRISGGPTSFNGSLLANGKVWLINPDGMLFGSTSSVNVNSLLLSTAGISNATGSGFFTNPTSHYNFDQAGNPTARIKLDHSMLSLQGNPAQGGDLLILAPQVTVTNGSQVLTLGGKMQLLAGETFTADFYGDGLINYAVINSAVSTKVTGSTSSVEVSNGSSLQFGTVTVGALIKQDAVLDHVINLGGQYETGTYNLATNPEHVVLKVTSHVYETIIPNPVVNNPPPLVTIASNADAFTNTTSLTRHTVSLGDESVRDTTVNPSVSNVSYERPYRVDLPTSLEGGALTLLAPSAGPSAAAAPSANSLANLTPSAGGDNAAASGNLADLTPAEGGSDKMANCANSFLDKAWMNDPTLSKCSN